jgi:hypothetical protein
MNHVNAGASSLPLTIVMASEETGISDVLTNLAVPKTEATLTIRIIKSFEFRTEKSLVLHNINLETTSVGELKENARKGMPVGCGSLVSICTTLDGSRS